MATGVSGGLSITSTAKVTEPLCSSKALSTGTLTDEFHALQRRTEFCSWDLLLTSGIGTTPKQLVSSGETEILKAAAGFWTISDRCLGGRIMRG